MDENLKITGTLSVKHYNEANILVHSQEIPNLVVTSGKSHIASRINSDSGTKMSHMAIGGDSTTPVAGDTTLGGEMGRVAFSSVSVASNTLTYGATFPGGTATGTVNESGTMLCRTVFADVNKGASDAVVIAWNVSVS